MLDEEKDEKTNQFYEHNEVYKKNEEKCKINNNKEEQEDAKSIDSIIKKYVQIYLRLKPKQSLENYKSYSDILNELGKKYDARMKLYKLKTTDGLLIDYSQLNDEEKEDLKLYLSNISKDKNIELFIEGLHRISC